jgi:hypothetical protein
MDNRKGDANSVEEQLFLPRRFIYANEICRPEKIREEGHCEAKQQETTDHICLPSVLGNRALWR